MSDDCGRMDWTEFREQVRAIMRGEGDLTPPRPTT